MGRDIIKGIAKAIKGEFGGEYTVYSEKVTQGVKKPCFFIGCEHVSEIPYPMGRYLRENEFSVSFYPAETGGEKEQCGNAVQRLFKCLEYIIVGGNLTRGSKMNCEIRDGVLRFTVHYDMFVFKREERAPAMGKLVYCNGKEKKGN